MESSSELEMLQSYTVGGKESYLSSSFNFCWCLLQWGVIVALMCTEVKDLFKGNVR